MTPLHNLILSQTRSLGVHSVTATRGLIFDKAQAKWASAVLVALKLGDRSLGRIGGIETNHTRPTGAAAGLVLDLSLFDLADCAEQLYKVLVASRPWKLGKGVSS